MAANSSARVLLVSGSFAPREGGAERQLRAVLDQLADEGVTACVITQALPGEARVSTRPSGLLVRRVGSLFAFTRLPRIGQILFTITAAIKGLRFRPNSIVSLQFGSASAAGAIVSRLLRVPHVVRLTGGGTARFRSEPVARAHSRLGRVLTHFIAGHGNVAVIAPAKHLLEDFATSFESLAPPMRYIPNGVALTARTQPKTDSVIWYSRGGSARSDSLFIEVAEMCADVQFNVIGHPFEHGEATRANITHLGWVSHPEVVIASHRVLINTSPHEGMPNTALQALSSGTRVVGLANAGMSELKHGFPSAVSITEGGAEELASLLELALASPQPAPQAVHGYDDVLRIWRSVLIEGLEAYND